eukprot:CAMPEP_0184357538 /NCGR_PEP_ID=MMETSP1089-20130417/109366_1 /TAXON_ID=38269 ORGANISM="Gloeochaete wittrockiana, Strain SAG46.84" /NCGR_SAMPLE_ID=MMETSP1089 /ASSEMBLY_ACC=CAM_ASM_000445 /LENGTH=108 /DNA_ID=CAMNT_0026695377 /DNA_START=86 /DNA_END=408 /DNA_ORIENTATION=+
MQSGSVSISDILQKELRSGGTNNVPEWIDYLENQVFPALLPAIATLLRTVEPSLKTLSNNDRKRQPRSINAVYWLASFLMRHNPRETGALPGTAAMHSEFKDLADVWR